MFVKGGGQGSAAARAAPGAKRGGTLESFNQSREFKQARREQKEAAQTLRSGLGANNLQKRKGLDEANILPRKERRQAAIDAAKQLKRIEDEVGFLAGPLIPPSP
jgi:hypothetical protein